MAITPSKENCYILFTDGTVADLSDPLLSSDDINTTVTQMTEKHGPVLKAGNSPLKIFSEITGLKKNGEFARIGQTNWKNLFLIHGEFEYFMASVIVENVKHFIATSNTGIFWNFNVVDA